MIYWIVRSSLYLEETQLSLGIKIKMIAIISKYYQCIFLSILLYSRITLYFIIHSEKSVAAKIYIKMETSLSKLCLNSAHSLQKVTVFLRNHKKYALLFIVDPLMTNRSLKQLITERMFHSIKNLAIFFKGKQIDDSQNVLTLQNNSIFHIIDLNRTQTPELNLVFRLHKEPDRLITIKTVPKAIIRQIMHNQLKSIIGKGQNQVFLVYVGKPLNIFKKFSDQFVEDQSEIMIIEFKIRLNLEPRPNLYIDEINHTKVLKAASLASTKMNFAPAIGTSNDFSISKFKTSITKKIQPKIIQAGYEEESASPILKQKKDINNIKLEGTAPDSQLLGKYTGFDPHKKTAPGAEIQPKKIVVPHDPNFKQIKEETAPSNGGLFFKEDDFIFAGDAQLEQTENILPGSIEEAKKNLLKKKQSSQEYS